MTVEQSTDRVDPTPTRLAAAARSIVACPAGLELVVDGLDDVTADLGDGDTLGMSEVDGRPVFSCPADGALATAAAEGRSALLTVTSGLVGADDDGVLTLAGRLQSLGPAPCRCCDRRRVEVSIRLDYVQLRPSGGAPDVATGHRVPLRAYSSPAHQLNRGFLQRSAEHANACHQDELRRAVATTSDTRLGDVLGVHLTDLRADRVEIRWVDRTGAHSRLLRFPQPATTAAELGDLLRQELHAGLC